AVRHPRVSAVAAKMRRLFRDSGDGQVGARRGDLMAERRVGVLQPRELSPAGRARQAGPH
ncbi:unnamed protein product, partial [Ectocarpus sp. 4 AP-2014]